MKVRGFLVSAVLIGLILVTAGCSGKQSADPKQVGFSPQDYAGKTLVSKLRLSGSNEKGLAFADPTSGNVVFFLRTGGKENYGKLMRAVQAVGNDGYCLVTYKVDDQIAASSGGGLPIVGQIVDVEVE